MILLLLFTKSVKKEISEENIIKIGELNQETKAWINLRNFHRIAKEVNFYKYEPINETFYFVADNSFRIQEKMDKFITQYDKCMNLEYSCNLEKQKIYSKYGKKIFNNRK